MSEQELSELLAHPRLRSFMERVAEEAAARAFAQMSARKKRSFQRAARPAASGDLNYADAALFIGCPVTSVRIYAGKRILVKGRLKGTVTQASCAQFKTTYTPRPSGRISG